MTRISTDEQGFAVGTYRLLQLTLKTRYGGGGLHNDGFSQAGGRCDSTEEVFRVPRSSALDIASGVLPLALVSSGKPGAVSEQLRSAHRRLPVRSLGSTVSRVNERASRRRPERWLSVASSPRDQRGFAAFLSAKVSSGKPGAVSERLRIRSPPPTCPVPEVSRFEASERSGTANVLGERCRIRSPLHARSSIGEPHCLRSAR